jgi:hypothetical protein
MELDHIGETSVHVIFFVEPCDAFFVVEVYRGLHVFYDAREFVLEHVIFDAQNGTGAADAEFVF